MNVFVTDDVPSLLRSLAPDEHGFVGFMNDDLNALDLEGMTRLMCHAGLGHEEDVNTLLHDGADPNCASPGNGWTALMSSHCNGTITKLLIDSSADVDAQDSAGITPLMMAAAGGGPVRSEPQGPDPASGEGSAITSRNGYVAALKELLKAGAKTELRVTASLSTAIMEAAEKGHTQMVALLAENGAELNSQNRGGATALILAVGEGYPDVVQCLIAASADIDLADEHGTTPLMEAVTSNQPEILELLLQSGADVHLREEGGFNAVQIAMMTNNMLLGAKLIQAGATE